MGIDRILDMTRTAVILPGMQSATTIVAHQNKMLDREVFKTPFQNQIYQERNRKV